MLRKWSLDILKKGFSSKKKSDFHFNYEDVHEKVEEQFQFQPSKEKLKNYLSFKHNQFVPQSSKTLCIQNMSLKHLQDTPDFVNIPTLAHGLNKYLNGQIIVGDYGLGDIPQQISKQATQQMSMYRSPKNDPQLIQMAKNNKCKYFSSTSNISTPLIQLYFLFSNFRRPNLKNIFEAYPTQPRIHMISIRKPVTYILSKLKQQVYSIQSDKGFFKQANHVLMQLGTIGEYFLTNQKDKIAQMLQSKTVQKSQNYYRYAVVNNQVFLRSQIDCRDVDEHGKPFVFEIKTRASAPIRYDVQNYQNYMDYPIKQKRGKFQSFQREYYDLIRGGFLKYAFQIKIGRMDGAFIAYHNTKNIYGFEYVQSKELILRLFGDQFNFNMAFMVSNRMLKQINDYILQDMAKYKCDQFKIGFYANCSTNSMIVMVQVMDEIKQYPMTNFSPTKNFFDQFNKKIGILNKNIFKYEFSFYTFKNDTLIRNPQIYFDKHDMIEIKWNVHKFGRVHKHEYLLFLQEAYKLDSFFGNFKYNGSWSKPNQLMNQV